MDLLKSKKKGTTNKNAIKVEFTLKVSVEGLEDKWNGKSILCRWRRGVLKKTATKHANSGKTARKTCQYGTLETPFEDIPVRCTIYQSTKTMKFEEKQIAFTIQGIRGEDASDSGEEPKRKSKRKSKRTEKDASSQDSDL